MSKFKVSNGNYLLNGLFWEMVNSDKSTVLYTLKNEDHEGFPSLYRLYMACDDPTEYTFAITYLDGWEHWDRLCKCSWFKPYIKAWRTELEVRTRSGALRALRDAALEKGKDAAQINKFLLQGGWKPTQDKSKVGRPSKEAIKEEAERMFSDQQVINQDFERLKVN